MDQKHRKWQMENQKYFETVIKQAVRKCCTIIVDYIIICKTTLYWLKV